jgi:hypothetical protein
MRRVEVQSNLCSWLHASITTRTFKPRAAKPLHPQQGLQGLCYALKHPCRVPGTITGKSSHSERLLSDGRRHSVMRQLHTIDWKPCQSASSQ